MLHYIPEMQEDTFFGSSRLRILDESKSLSDVIHANFWHEELDNVKLKVYTGDLFTRD